MTRSTQSYQLQFTAVQLCRAVDIGKLSEVTDILEQDPAVINIPASARLGDTPLHHAVANGDEVIAALLIKRAWINLCVNLQCRTLIYNKWTTT